MNVGSYDEMIKKAEQLYAKIAYGQGVHVSQWSQEEKMAFFYHSILSPAMKQDLPLIEYKPAWR